ncbi:unnamed protein product [Calicophoron daubneyi]|uniref:RRM domain-containing protein n=1 Tax=Calicophoron daubneyi TaxID=300641 RepID=A0AAV2T887_CALDB
MSGTANDPHVPVSTSHLAPTHLIVFHVTTAGMQGEQLGLDEYPTVAITANSVNLADIEADGSEFQAFVRPVRLTIPTTDTTSAGEFTSVSMKAADQEVDNAEETVDDAGHGAQETMNAVSPDKAEVYVPLTEDCTAATGLTEDILLHVGSLADALEQFHQWLTRECLLNSDDEKDNSEEQEVKVCHTDNGSRNQTSFILVTDGPAPLRLVLHSEMAAKSIDAMQYPYLYHFLDIRKQFEKTYLQKWAPISSTRTHIPNLDDNNRESAEVTCSPPSDEYATFLHPKGCQGASETTQDEAGNKELPWTLEGQVNQFNANVDGTENSLRDDQLDGMPIVAYCRHLANLVRQMTKDGALWTDIETINDHYQPAFVRKTDNVEDDVVIRARGLPWQATDSDIFQFFSGINISKGGIALVLSKVGRRNGEALVRFTDRQQRDLALCKHKHHMGSRYIEVYAATGSEFTAFAGGESQEAEDFLSNVRSPHQALIRMRGLPYSADASQILQFFENANCPVEYGEDGILFVNHRDGRATGDAFVIFETERLAEEALKCHRQHIGNRYIELFRSTPAEVNQVMNNARNPSPLPTLKTPNMVSSWVPLKGLGSGLLVLEDGSSHMANLVNMFPSNVPPTVPVSPLQPFLPLPVESSLEAGTALLENSYEQNTPVMRSSLMVPPMYTPHNQDQGTFIPNACVCPSDQSAQSSLNIFPSLQTKGKGFVSGLPPFQPMTLVNTKPFWPGTGDTSELLTLEQLTGCFIKISGMPLDADIVDILAFMGDSWPNVVLHGIHQVYNTFGQPTGEAIVQFSSEQAAQSLIVRKNGSLFIRRGTSLGSMAIVRVSHCTVDDVNQLLITISKVLLQNSTNVNKPTMQPAIFPLSSQSTVEPASTATQAGKNHSSGFSSTVQIPPPIPQTTSESRNERIFEVLHTSCLNMFPYFPTPFVPQPTSQCVFSGGSHFPRVHNPFPLPNYVQSPTPGTPPQFEQCPPLSVLQCNSSGQLPIYDMSDRMKSNILNTDHFGASVLGMDSFHTPSVIAAEQTGSVPDLTGDQEGKQSPAIWKQEWSSGGETQPETSSTVRKKSKYSSPPPERNGKAVILVKGLPPDSLIQDIKEWFEKIIDCEQSPTVSVEYSRDGSPNGNATIYCQHEIDTGHIITEMRNRMFKGHQLKVMVLGQPAKLD